MKKIYINITEEQKTTFKRLREILASEDVRLSYPDFTKPFDLTTDASGFELCVALSQDNRPITVISHTLRDNEKMVQPTSESFSP